MITYGTRKARRNYPALRERVKQAGYTQEEIAEMIGTTAPNASMKFCGKRRWSQTDIEIIAAELGLSYEEIGRMFFYRQSPHQYNRDGEC